MERDANYVLVGSIVLISIAGLVIFLTWLFSGLTDEDTKRYSIIFNDSVAGLNVNGPVEYKGVRVGKVIAIVIDEDRPEQVRVDIEVREDTPVRKQTHVELGLQGITGMSRIELETSDQDKELAQKTDLAPYPLLKGDGRQITKLFENIPKIAANILEISDKLNIMLDEKTTQDVQMTIARVNKLMAQADKLFSDANIANVATTLDNTAQASADFVEIGERFERTASEFEKVAQELSDTIQESQRGIDKFTEEGIDQMLGLSQESRAMAKEIRKLADKLEDDPSSIIYKPQDDGVKIAP